MNTTMERDNRGRTYHFELNGRRVQMWYNRYEKSWVTYREDDEQSQLGASSYVYSKDEALADVKYFLNQSDEAWQRAVGW